MQLVVKAMLLLVGLVAMATAADPPTVPNRFGGAPPSSPSGYHPGGYGGYNRYHPLNAVREVLTADQPLDLLDRLWERINDVERRNRFAGEVIDSLDARMSLLKREVHELELLTLPAILTRNQHQQNDIGRLNEHLDDLSMDLDGLYNDTQHVVTKNTQNADVIVSVEAALSAQRRIESRQAEAIESLHAQVKDFKTKLFTVLVNEFEVLDDQVERTERALNVTTAKEQARLCETGSVTLNPNTLRAEYLFSSKFEKLPNLVYSLSGLKTNLNARSDPPQIGYSPYAPPHPKEPNSIGAIVLANPTSVGVTFQGFDLSFGDSVGQSYSVSFQACSIGAGTELAADTYDEGADMPNTTDSM